MAAGSGDPPSEPGALALPASQSRALPRYTLLGLIVVSGGEARGDELARHFERGRFLGAVIHIGQAMTHHYLRKLAGLGWIVIASDPSRVERGRPSRQRCQITLAGRQKFAVWLSCPVGPEPGYCPEFLVKLYLASCLDPELATRLIESRRQELTRLKSALAVEDIHSCERPGPMQTRLESDQLLHRLQCLQVAATLDWLHDDAAWRRMPAATPIDRS